MSNWRKFAATNEPGTCRWCGRKLRAARFAWFGNGRGDYGDGYFCGLRCGYLFGRALARERQLVPESE